MTPQFLRTAAAPFATAQLFLGVLLAKGWPPPKASLFAWVVFGALLNGGALALHSAFAPNSLGMTQPLKARRPRAIMGFVLLAAALFFSARFLPTKPGGKYFFEIVMTCVLMSVLHSVPPVRLATRGSWSLLLPCAGFGFFAPMAGWCATGRGLEPVLVDLCIGFFFLFAVLSVLFQVLHWEEDSHQGPPTLVVQMTVPRSLTYATGALLVAHLYFLQAILKHHRHLVTAGFVETLDRGCVPLRLPQGGPSPAFLLISLLGWLGLLIPWRLRWKQLNSLQVQASLNRGLFAWTVTDLSLLMLLWPRE